MRSLRAMETRLDQRIDQVKAELKDVRFEVKASEERQGRDIQVLRSDVRFLGDKLDRVLEHFLPAKGAAVPTTGQDR